VWCADASRVCPHQVIRRPGIFSHVTLVRTHPTTRRQTGGGRGAVAVFRVAGGARVAAMPAASRPREWFMPERRATRATEPEEMSTG